MSEFEFDTPDIDTNVSDLSDTPADDLEDGANPLDAPDDDFYHAEHMSDEEVKRRTILMLNPIKHFHLVTCPI